MERKKIIYFTDFRSLGTLFMFDKQFLKRIADCCNCRRSYASVVATWLVSSPPLMLTQYSPRFSPVEYDEVADGTLQIKPVTAHKRHLTTLVCSTWQRGCLYLRVTKDRIVYACWREKANWLLVFKFKNSLYDSILVVVSKCQKNKTSKRCLCTRHSRAGYNHHLYLHNCYYYYYKYYRIKKIKIRALSLSIHCPTNVTGAMATMALCVIDAR